MNQRVVVVAAALACGLLLAAACSSDTSASSGSPPTSPASTDALTPTQTMSPLPEAALHPARRLGAHVPGKVLSMPWQLVGVRRGGHILVVDYISGDGIRPHGVTNIGFRVIESSASVELVAVSLDENPGRDEADSLATGTAEIVLSTPLGTRTLLHAPTNSDWPATLLAR